MFGKRLLSRPRPAIIQPVLVPPQELLNSIQTNCWEEMEKINKIKKTIMGDDSPGVNLHIDLAAPTQVLLA